MRFLQSSNKTLTTKKQQISLQKARLNTVYIHTFLMKKQSSISMGDCFFVQTTIYAFFLLSGIISISSR